MAPGGRREYDRGQQPMSNPPPMPLQAGAAALTPEQLGDLMAARRVHRAVRRACAVASGDGWTTAAFGGLTAVASLGSWPTLLLGLGMVVLGWRQVRFAGRLKQLDPEAPACLAATTLMTASLLAAYAAFNLVRGLRDPRAFFGDVTNDPMVSDLLGNVDGLMKLVIVALYGMMLAIAVVGGLATAWYYRSRRKHLLAYLHDTPAWILQLQRAGMSL